MNVFTRAAIALGFAEGPSVVRSSSELPIMGSPYAAFINPVNLTSDTSLVTTDRAMGLVGVSAAVAKISTAISQLQLGVWRGDTELAQPTTSIVVQPNIGISLSAFLEQTVTSLILNGNAYWLLTKDGPTGAVQNITVLNPNTVRFEVDDNGRTWYRDGDSKYPSWRVSHLWNVRLPGYTYGVGPIQLSQNELRGALNLRNYADNWFTDGNVPNGILKTDQTITAEMADAYAQRWADVQSGHGTAVMGNGIDYTPLILNPADAQWLESQRFSQAQIARMFGVPGILLDLPSGDSMTYSNREDVINDFYRFTLKKYMTEIEAGFTQLLVRGQVAKFKADTLLGMVPEGDLATPDAQDNANTDNTGDSTNGNGN